MDKLDGFKLGAYEIVSETSVRDPEYDYEELTVNELLSRTGHSEDAKTTFIREIFAVNIHKLLARETYKSCFELVDKVAADPRLSKLKAVVFLALKPKGGRNTFHSLESVYQYKELLAYAMSKCVQVGFDSCSGPHALKSLPKKFEQQIECCESSLFSAYCNCQGELFPCSFTEGTDGWENGISLLDESTAEFTKNVWMGPRLSEWRKNLLQSSQGKGCAGCPSQKTCRSCPIYPVTLCKTNPES